MVLVEPTSSGGPRDIEDGAVEGAHGFQVGYSGGGISNKRTDRDYLTFNVKYSF